MMPNLAIVEDFRPESSTSSNIRAAVGELRSRHATDLVAALIERMRDRDVLESAAQFIVTTLSNEDAARERRRASMPTRQVRMRHHAERAVQAKALVAQVKAAATAGVLSMLINGRELRFLTGAEIGRLGTGFARLAARVAPHALCGEVLTEAEAATLIDLKAS
jgi:hypothetical protein